LNHFCPRRRLRGHLYILLIFAGFALPVWGLEKTHIRVDDYQIDAELDPHEHQISARVRVAFTALADVNTAIFELHNGLKVSKVVDAAGKPQSAERIAADSTVRVDLPSTLKKGSSSVLIFEYDGTLESSDDSPVQGLKLASVSDETSVLLYGGRWFPVNGYGINRFTSTIHITVPAHMVVVGSGTQTVADGQPSKKSNGLPTKTYTFTTTKASFPGTIVAGAFQEFKSDEAGLDLHLYLKPIHQNLGAQYTETAVKEYTFFVPVWATGFEYAANCRDSR
jgi:hypothetical protein